MRSSVVVVGAVLGVVLALGAGSAAWAQEPSLGAGPGAAVTGEGNAAAALEFAEAVTPTGTEVEIDIRPGSDRNPVNPKSKGVLPVAILSSETFDAIQVDPSTVFLAEAPVSSPSQQGKYLTAEEDVNADGLTDLVVKIETELLVLESPTGPAVLIGSTFDGQAFWGEDLFTLVPPDIANDSWALEAIAACMGSDIVSGYPDGLYRPATKVSRDQMAAFIVRAAAGGDSQVPKATGGATFGDVNKGSWAYDYIEYAAAAGIVEGYSDGSYHPDWTVNRGEMAAFMARSIASPQGEEGLVGYQPPASQAFADVANDSWCSRYVEYLAERGLISGYPDATYRPADPVSRDQMAVYIARAFGLL
ncbi:MAG: S-layer homology domain-containing protein [Armatimonadota bacterium]